MGESTAATLLTGKRKWWVGIAWALLLVGVAVLPDVDRSIARYSELGTLRVKLASLAELPERARMLAERVAQMEEEMADLEAALVPAEALSTFRQDVTRLARSAGCQLRSIRPGPISRRSLDELMGRANNSAKGSAKKPEWEVEEQVSSMSIQGSFGSLLGFLSTLETEARILELSALQLHPPPGASEELVLELGIKTFDLHRSHPR